MDSNLSESTDIFPRKQRHCYTSPDSDLELYDTSHRHGKELTRRPYKRKVKQRTNRLDKGLSEYKKCKGKYNTLGHYI